MRMDIAQAKAILAAQKPIFHEHDDSVWIVYQWLDAQIKTKHPFRKFRALKHIIENWGRRYVSQSDVEVAALMHPDIRGVYPRYNISAKLTRPSDRRLDGIATARTQRYRTAGHEYSRAESE